MFDADRGHLLHNVKTNTVLCTQSTWKAQISNYSRFPSLVRPIKQVLFTFHLSQKQHVVNRKYLTYLKRFYYTVWCTAEKFEWKKPSNLSLAGVNLFAAFFGGNLSAQALLCKQASISSEVRCSNIPGHISSLTNCPSSSKCSLFPKVRQCSEVNCRYHFRWGQKHITLFVCTGYHKF